MTAEPDGLVHAPTAASPPPRLAALPGYLLWRAHWRVNALLAQTLPYGADIHVYAALVVLSEAGPLSQQALADRICMSRTTMVTVGELLEREGLAERVRNPSDRRSYVLTQTDKGAAAEREWQTHVRRVEERFTAGLTRTDRDRLRTHLGAILRDRLDPSTPADVRSSVGFLVSRAHVRLHRRATDALRPLGIEPRHIGSLAALCETGPISQRQLARMLEVSDTTVVQIVDDLQDRDIVVRQRNPADRRSYLLHLHERSPALLSDALARTDEIVRHDLANLGPDSTDDLVRLLQTVAGVQPGPAGDS